MGIKHDSEKNRLDLLPPELIEATGHILTFGAKKYAAQEWRTGIEYSRIIGAIMRHFNAWLKGEENDLESGKPHLWHMTCNLAFLITFEAHPEKYQKFDDRYLYVKGD